MVKLWGHQARALAEMTNAHLLYAGMASGKTVIALEWVRKVAPGRPALIIAPKAALYVYRQDNNDLYDGQLPVHVLDKGTIARRREKMLELSCSANIVVVNYEAAWRIDGIGQMGWGAVVLDEAHRVGMYNSKTTLTLTRAFEQVENKLVMSGTPFHDGYEKLYSIVRFLDGFQPENARAHPRSRLFGHYDDFLNNFCVTYTIPNRPYVRAIGGYKNVDELTRLISGFTTTIRTEDVVKLPELVVTRVPAPMPAAMKQAYRTASKDNVLPDGNVFAPGVLTALLRLGQLVSSGELYDVDGVLRDRFNPTGRIKALEELLEQAGGEPLVIFTRFQRDVELVASVVQDKLGEVPLRLTGAQDDVEAWANGGAQVLIANIGAGAEGVRLERAHIVIFWSLSYSHSEYAQAIGRCRRPGNTSNTVFSYELVSPGTVDVDVYNTLHDKQSNTEDLTKRLRTGPSGNRLLKRGL